MGVNPKDLPEYVKEETEEEDAAPIPQEGRVDWDKFLKHEGPIESVHNIEGDPYETNNKYMSKAME